MNRYPDLPPPSVQRAPKTHFTTSARPAYDRPPPPYSPVMKDSYREFSWFRPQTWSRRRQVIVGSVVVILLIIIIVIVVEVVKANRYPNYSKLNYSLAQTYQGESFFDNFQYFFGYDPAQGFVHYTDQGAAVALNLTFASATSAILRVDTSNTDSTTGRKSARIQSKQTYNDGLFIFDIIHSPYGCATWPALWMTNPYNWPTDGEIDIVEATNAANVGNQVTLHTTNGCSMSVKRKESGSVLNSNCYNGTDDNQGCGVRGPTASYGQEFNQNGGGVYATELRNEGIRTWFFPRSSVPSDVASVITNNGSSTTPDPSTWGEALADFPSTDCDISSHFQNQSIIADIDLCGQWAGLSQYYTQESHCPGTCIDYVSTQPGTAFSEAYWEFAGFWVYQSS